MYMNLILTSYPNLVPNCTVTVECRSLGTMVVGTLLTNINSFAFFFYARNNVITMWLEWLMSMVEIAIES